MSAHRHAGYWQPGAEREGSTADAMAAAWEGAGAKAEGWVPAIAGGAMGEALR